MRALAALLSLLALVGTAFADTPRVDQIEVRGPITPVVAGYVERGIALSVSPACGALTWRSALPSVVRCERDAAPHYWHHGVAAAARNGA